MGEREKKGWGEHTVPLGGVGSEERSALWSCCSFVAMRAAVEQ